MERRGVSGVGLRDTELPPLIRLVHHLRALRLLDLRHNELSPPSVRALRLAVSDINDERQPVQAHPLELLVEPMLDPRPFARPHPEDLLDQPHLWMCPSTDGSTSHNLRPIEYRDCIACACPIEPGREKAWRRRETAGRRRGTEKETSRRRRRRQAGESR